ncbi:hypothetical protein [Streptomyces sp. NPDC005805]|uniref:hypothetical protein n=1 Tax=Streptomyces sp. NPDC005805 TaxID=3157068 RepID=UPI0033F99763
MQSAAPGRGHRGHRGVPAVVCVLLGLLPALLGCATAAAGGAPGAGSVPPGAVMSGPVASSGAVAAGPGSSSAGAVSPVAAVETLRDGVPGCGRSGAPGEDGGAVPGTPARGASVYELLPGLHQVPVLTGGALPPAACAGPGPVTHRGPPPVEPPTPVGLSVLRV